MSADTPATALSVCVYVAALKKLDACRNACPGIGGDVDAANLRWLLEHDQRSATSEQQAARTLESLSSGLEIRAGREVEALRSLDAHAALLGACELVGNCTSGNVHGFHGHLVTAARRGVKAAGGELRAVGWYAAGESEPMSPKERERVKAQRFLSKMKADGMVWSYQRAHWVTLATQAEDAAALMGEGI